MLLVYAKALFNRPELLRVFIVHNMLRMFVAVVGLMLGAVTLPTFATEGLQSTNMSASDTQATYSMPVLFKTDIRHMKVEELAAIVAGAAIVGTIADMYLDNGLFTILGITAGAILGNHWYEEGLWPFHH
ncbi:hypothetical protein TI03_06420 [Achromatium sp. WMS1]|nr:hypothetical protein TI03_06420 [Achromatium sp. WMS1]